MKLFDRKVILKVTDTKLNKSLEFKDLDIEFSIEKEDTTTPNKAKFVVYNLSADSRTFISKALNISFYAGYEIANEVIFVGQIIKNGISHETNGVDWVTTIDAQDGVNGLNEVKVDKSYKGVVNVSDVINYLLKEMGLGKGYFEIPNKSYNNGIVLSGFARDRLKEICGKHRLELSIQDGNAYIMPKASKVNASVVTVNSESGLIGSPTKTDKGISFTTLLNPALKVNHKVTVDSLVYKGSFKIKKLTHSGSDYGDDFYSKVEAE